MDLKTGREAIVMDPTQTMTTQRVTWGTLTSGKELVEIRREQRSMLCHSSQRVLSVGLIRFRLPVACYSLREWCGLDGRRF